MSDVYRALQNAQNFACLRMRSELWTGKSNLNVDQVKETVKNLMDLSESYMTKEGKDEKKNH